MFRQTVLGLTLYEMLALKPAFLEKDRHRLMKLVSTQEPVRLDSLNRAIPRDLATEEKAKRQAESHFAKARKAVDDYFTKVSESQLLQVPGLQPLRRDLLQSALTFYQDFLKERGDDPALRGELAAAYLRVGKIRSEMREADEARKAYEQARALYEALTKAAPESVEWRHGLAQCCRGSVAEVGAGQSGHSESACRTFQGLLVPRGVPARVKTDRAVRADHASGPRGTRPPDHQWGREPL
jgi:tetratricopeptide (TPR) repeat protein